MLRLLSDESRLRKRKCRASSRGGHSTCGFKISSLTSGQCCALTGGCLPFSNLRSTEGISNKERIQAHVCDGPLLGLRLSLSWATTGSMLTPRRDVCRPRSSERSLSELLWLWQRGAQPSACERLPTSARSSEPAAAASSASTAASLRGQVSSRGAWPPPTAVLRVATVTV